MTVTDKLRTAQPIKMFTYSKTATQQSVHWTLGILRHFENFLASSFSCSQALSTPAPAPVTQTVGQPYTKVCHFLKAKNFKKLCLQCNENEKICNSNNFVCNDFTLAFCLRRCYGCTYPYTRHWSNHRIKQGWYGNVFCAARQIYNG